MVTDGNDFPEKHVFPEKKVVSTSAKALPFVTIKRIGLAIFYRLKDVFCFTDD